MASSCASQVNATASFETFERLISTSGEYLSPPASLPYVGQSTDFCARTTLADGKPRIAPTAANRTNRFKTRIRGRCSQGASGASGTSAQWIAPTGNRPQSTLTAESRIFANQLLTALMDANNARGNGASGTGTCARAFDPRDHWCVLRRIQHSGVWICRIDLAKSATVEAQGAGDPQRT